MNAAFYSLQARCTLLTWTLFFLFVFSFAETGQALVSSGDKIIFVGSPGVGKMVYLWCLLKLMRLIFLFFSIWFGGFCLTYEHAFCAC